MRGPVGGSATGRRWIARNVLFAEAQRRYDAARPARPARSRAAGTRGVHLAVPPPPRRRAVVRLPTQAAAVPHALVGRCGRTPRPTGSGRTGGPSRHCFEARVLVSQGSIRPDLTELVEPAVRALADAASSSSSPPAGRPGRPRTHVRRPAPCQRPVAKVVPYDQLLPHVSCFVTNGGYTGVTLALHHGVPLVQAGSPRRRPRSGPDPMDRRRREARHQPPELRRAPRGRPRARRRQVRRRRWTGSAEMAEHDAGREGADLLERLPARTMELCDDRPPPHARDPAHLAGRLLLVVANMEIDAPRPSTWPWRPSTPRECSRCSGPGRPPRPTPHGAGRARDSSCRSASLGHPPPTSRG